MSDPKNDTQASDSSAEQAPHADEAQTPAESNAAASDADASQASDVQTPDEIDSTPEGSKKKGKKYKLKTYAGVLEAAVDYGMIPPPDPDEKGIDKKERKQRKKELEAFKERLVHDIELAKKRGPIRWGAAAAIPFVVIAFMLVGWIWGDAMAEGAIRQALVQALGPSTQVEIENVSFSIFGPSITVEELRAHQPAKPLYFDPEKPDYELLEKQMEGLSEKYSSDDWCEIVALKEFTANVEFWPLLSGRLWISELELSDGLIQPNNINPMDAPKPGSGKGKGAGKGKKGKSQVPPKPAEEEKPEEGPLESVNEWVDTFEKYRDDPYVQKALTYAQEWRNSRGEADPADAEEAPGMSLAASPRYIQQAMAENRRPKFLLRELNAGQVSVSTEGKPDPKRKHAFGKGGDDGVLTIKNVSSEPALWGEFITASGKLGTAVQASINYSKQKKDAATPSSIHVALDKVGAKNLFGEDMRDAMAGLLFFPEARELPGGLRSSDVFHLKGKVGSGSVDASLWIPRSGGMGALGFRMHQVPLNSIASGLGDLPFGFQEGMLGTITTCTEDGEQTYDPADPVSCFVLARSGLSMTLSLTLTKAGLVPKSGERVLGLRSEDFCDFFNAWIMKQESVEFRFRVDTAKGQPFELIYPGERWLLDSLIDSATISGERLNSWTLGEGGFAAHGEITLRSVDADNQPRLDDSGEPIKLNLDRKDDSLAGLRASAGLTNLQVTRFFGTSANTVIPKARLIIQLFDDQSTFSPRVVGGQRGLADAVLSSMDAEGQELNGWTGDVFTFEPGGDVDLTSIDEQGQPRKWDDPRAASNDMSNLRASANLEGVRVAKIGGMSVDSTLPDMLVGLRVLDEDEDFSPRLEPGSRRPIVMALVKDLQWKPSELGASDDLMGLKFEDDMRIGLIPPKDEQQHDGVPLADGEGLANLGFDVQLMNARVDPAKQSNPIVAKRWNTYIDKRNGVIPAKLNLFDASESFSPDLEVDERALVEDMGDALSLSKEDITSELKGWAKDQGLGDLIGDEEIPESAEDIRNRAEEEARKLREAQEAEEAERKAREEAERIKKEKEEAERKAREEAERLKKEKEEAERKAREAAERARKEAEKLKDKWNPFGK